MKASITISQIWFNPNTIGRFFFREQSKDTLEEFITKSSEGQQKTLLILDSVTENMDLSEFEEMCHNDSVEEIAEQLGLDYISFDNDEENEDNEQE